MTTLRLEAAAPVARPAAVVLEGLSRGFGGRRILDGISLTIAAGEFVALIGRSGSGKSTLLRALARLDDDAEREGVLHVPAQSSVLFQDARLLPWIRVLDNVMLGLRDSEARSRALKLLADVGLAGREAAWPETLSGGEKQRVALARALAHEPELLLADEPFGALDALTRLRMHALLFQLIGRYRPTVLLVTHDVDEALTLADRVLVMEEGRIALDRPVDLPHPRRPSDARYETLRRSLLAALGVFA
ncbi:MAG: ABC transporter ATP-binding protein [Pseudomonadota bacterium]|jgi:ABC-type nitrate/sulfonate/bicarbonate transport system, ATPase component|nr:MAG: sulfonate ABC transporter ATP-binding protein [Pseudomonadota bacterium]